MLDDRKLAVLRAIVEDYVSTHEPVGSKAIVERHRLGVSAATVRNEMAALEDEGYIAQPHTSAGRIPTDLGYRVFVDRLNEVKPMSAAEQRAIARCVAGAEWKAIHLATAVDLVEGLVADLAAIGQRAAAEVKRAGSPLRDRHAALRAHVAQRVGEGLVHGGRDRVLLVGAVELQAQHAVLEFRGDVVGVELVRQGERAMVFAQRELAPRAAELDARLNDCPKVAMARVTPERIRMAKTTSTIVMPGRAAVNSPGDSHDRRGRRSALGCTPRRNGLRYRASLPRSPGPRRANQGR